MRGETGQFHRSEGYLRLAETWRSPVGTPVLRQGHPALCAGNFWKSLRMEVPQQYCALSEGKGKSLGKEWPPESNQCIYSICLPGVHHRMSCVGRDACDQHKQISEGRTELHVEWTHVVLRGGPIISCDLCSSLFPQENGSACALMPFLKFGWGLKLTRVLSGEGAEVPLGGLLHFLVT